MSGVGFHLGTKAYTPSEIAGRLLGYDRDAVEPGSALPASSIDRELCQAMLAGDEVVFAFHGKLGDSLLAFGAVRAVLSWLGVERTERMPRLAVDGPFAALMLRSDLGLESATTRAAGHRAARRVVVGDAEGIRRVASWPGQTIGMVWCDPAEPPCWVSGSRTFPSQPDRHYLSVERRLGVRLTDEPPFLPLIRVEAEGAVPLRVGVVSATSWPSRKDYGLARFTETGRLIAAVTGRPVELLEITGAGVLPSPSLPYDGSVRTVLLGPVPANSAVSVFAGFDLVLGNDTGMTHLAAMSRRLDGAGPQVIGLHARHSHSRWRTGLAWHHSIATAFSDLMHHQDTCPVYDRIDDRRFGAAADIGTIAAEVVAAAASSVLAEPTRGRAA